MAWMVGGEDDKISLPLKAFSKKLLLRKTDSVDEEHEFEPVIDAEVVIEAEVINPTAGV